MHFYIANAYICVADSEEQAVWLYIQHLIAAESRCPPGYEYIKARTIRIPEVYVGNRVPEYNGIILAADFNRAVTEPNEYIQHWSEPPIYHTCN